MASASLILPQAVLFDMDGTLTTDTLNLNLIRADLGLAPGVAILESIATMPADRRTQAEAILHDFELSAASQSQLNEGCLDLLDWLERRSIKTALITRNTRKSVQTVLERHGIDFSVQITREDGVFKPKPDPLLHACLQLGVAASAAWMVGDWKYDIEAANAAGVFGVWLTHGRANRPFDAVPDLAVRDLLELSRVLQSLAHQAA